MCRGGVTAGTSALVFLFFKGAFFTFLAILVERAQVSLVIVLPLPYSAFPFIYPHLDGVTWVFSWRFLL